jgi:hypothetical protein
MKRTKPSYEQKQEVDNDVLLERINNLIETNKIDHAALLVQTTKTNDRVTKLEAWRNVVTGALIILNVVVWPIVLLFITKRI